MVELCNSKSPILYIPTPMSKDSFIFAISLLGCAVLFLFLFRYYQKKLSHVSEKRGFMWIWKTAPPLGRSVLKHIVTNIGRAKILPLDLHKLRISYTYTATIIFEWHWLAWNRIMNAQSGASFDFGLKRTAIIWFSKLNRYERSPVEYFKQIIPRLSVIIFKEYAVRFSHWLLIYILI